MWNIFAIRIALNVYAAGNICKTILCIFDIRTIQQKTEKKHRITNAKPQKLENIAFN